MAFFTLGNHHDFAIAAVAFKIGDKLDELRQAKAELEVAGVAVEAHDHGVTQCRYVGRLEARRRGWCAGSSPGALTVASTRPPHRDPRPTACQYLTAVPDR